MNRILHIICCLLIAASNLYITSCGDNSQFRISGTIDGLGTQNLRVIYYTKSGIKSETATAVDGKFNFIGNAPDETMVEIFTNDRTPMMQLAVKNGDAIELKFNREKPTEISIKGNNASKKIATFIHDNSALLTKSDNNAINKAIATYIGNNTNNISSTILLLSKYTVIGHEAEADSLMHLIDKKARPDFLIDNLATSLAERNAKAEKAKVMPLKIYTIADSMSTYKPAASSYSLLVFTRTQQDRPDSVLFKIETLLATRSVKSIRVVDISLANDSASWHSLPKPNTDSKRYISAWMPGAISAIPMKQLSIIRTPFYVLVDSTGSQLYRGQSIASATSKANKLLSTK